MRRNAGAGLRASISESDARALESTAWTSWQSVQRELGSAQ